MKEVSIIVPFYRGLLYLDECFESIMEQGLDSETYEVLCMGDAPEEGIVSIVDKYESAGMPVRYIQWFENKGVSYARNRGLALADAKYIYFLDSDDYMMPGCIERLLECAVKNDAGIVRGDILTTDEGKSAFDTANRFNGGIKCDKKGNDALLTSLFENEVTVLNMLIKKELADENNITFPDGVRYFSDVEFVMKALMSAGEYYLAKGAVLAKRKRSFAGISDTKVENMIRDFVSVYKTSVSIENLSPKRRNILCGLMCQNVLDLLKSGYELNDETARYVSVYVKDAVKNVPNRFAALEKQALLFAGRRQFAIARRIIRIQGVHLKGRFVKFLKGSAVAAYKIMQVCLPVKKTIVVFSSALGRSYAGNPKAIYEEMLRMGFDKKYTFVWFYDNTPHNIPGKHRQIRFKSFRYLFYMSIAGFWIFDARQPKFIRKNNRVVYLQTWHGTPLKKLGLDIDNVYMSGETDIGEYHDEFRKNAGMWDMLISQNEFSSGIFRRAFDFTGKMLETGYPRNDRLVTCNNPADISAVKKKLGLPDGKKVILYAPTWRDDDASGLGVYHFTCGLDIGLMKESFEDEAVLAVKYHYLVKDNIDWSVYGDFVHVFDEAADITDIYLASDMLITDYSSVMFDYSLLRRPMYFYCYDLAKYKNVLRGFYFDFEETAPGPISLTTKQLVQDMKTGLSEKYKDKYDNFVEKYNPWDDGHASEKIIGCLFKEG
ncbi:MAG: bifunctional glycosyltransferase family 2 protein/CDP-glycerol:glycerophosphate glycerophosphotransferase [Lachnospiraceae bacterium]|nr:bifunctional glycosyltransferase family 2 protein/CDP-glycerol:glycerophosphate glycerophosphotransferase [Lachnospiraceae bacterium]